MAKPKSREAFKQYCLRNLGSPVIDINADDEQLEDRIDEALQYYRDYHFDGTIHSYLKHQITSVDVTNKYLPISDNVHGIVKIFSIGGSNGGSSSNLFNINYQIHLNDLYKFSSSTFAPYVSAMTNIAMMQEIFVGKQPIDYNRHVNKLHIHMDWNKVKVGDYIVMEAYLVSDPEIYTDVWNDRWLLRYGTALFKRQWGENLSKFAGVQLPGGITLDGPRIASEANEEIRRLEEEMINSYSLPVSDFLG